MRGLMAAGLLAVCSAAAAQSVTTYDYDARGRLTAVRSGIGARSDYNLDAADNRSGYHAAQQFATAYAATSLPHVVGYADGGGWAVSAGTSGFMTFGPYTTSVPAGSHVATWRLMVDNNSADSGKVVKLDVFDATAVPSLGGLNLFRQQRAAPVNYQMFKLPLTLKAAGYAIEMRRLRLRTHTSVRQGRLISNMFSDHA